MKIVSTRKPEEDNHETAKHRLNVALAVIQDILFGWKFEHLGGDEVERFDCFDMFDASYENFFTIEEVLKWLTCAICSRKNNNIFACECLQSKKLTTWN